MTGGSHRRAVRMIGGSDRRAVRVTGGFDRWAVRMIGGSDRRAVRMAGGFDKRAVRVIGGFDRRAVRVTGGFDRWDVRMIAGFNRGAVRMIGWLFEPIQVEHIRCRCGEQNAPTPPVGSQHSCQPTVKLHILPLVWIFPLGKGSIGRRGQQLVFSFGAARVLPVILHNFTSLNNISNICVSYAL